MPSIEFLSELHKTASWRPDISRTPIEHLVEFLLTGTLAPNAPPELEGLAEEALRLDLRDTRVVVLGGGTGLSTIVGGNSQMPDWFSSSRPPLWIAVCLVSLRLRIDNGLRNVSSSVAAQEFNSASCQGPHPKRGFGDVLSHSDFWSWRIEMQKTWGHSPLSHQKGPHGYTHCAQP